MSMANAQGTMDWDKLKVFHAAAEAGSFTHAGERLGAIPRPLARRLLSDDALVGVAQLPVGDLAHEHDGLPRRFADLGALAVGELDDEARGVRIPRAPERAQHVREHLGVVGAHGLAGNGLPQRVELTLRPVRNLGRGVSRRLHQRGDGAFAHLL